MKDIESNEKGVLFFVTNCLSITISCLAIAGVLALLLYFLIQSRKQ